MLPMKPLRLALGTLLAAQSTTLAPAVDANKIALVKNDVTPVETLAIGDLELANFTGSTPIAGSTGAQQTGIDPITGQQRITIKDPVGGYRWVTGDAVGLPQTIFGYALINNAGDTLLGYGLLPEAVELQAAGEEINLGSVTMTFVAEPLA